MKEFTDEECSFILYCLNHYWHYCHTELAKKSLGNIERQTLEREQKKAQDLITKIDW